MRAGMNIGWGKRKGMTNFEGSSGSFDSELSLDGSLYDVKDMNHSQDTQQRRKLSSIVSLLPQLFRHPEKRRCGEIIWIYFCIVNLQSSQVACPLPFWQYTSSELETLSLG